MAQICAVRSAVLRSVQQCLAMFLAAWSPFLSSGAGASPMQPIKRMGEDEGSSAGRRCQSRSGVGGRGSEHSAGFEFMFGTERRLTSFPGAP